MSGYNDTDQGTWTTWRVMKTLMLVIFLCSVLGTFSCALGLFTGAARSGVKVIEKEFYPEALLKKYEWFKDASAALDKKQADISVYNVRLELLASEYTGTPRGKWARDDREQSSIWQSELAGVKASYNSLAAEYNSEMVKFNWKFANVGELPKGGQPVPREYRVYQEK